MAGVTSGPGESATDTALSASVSASVDGIDALTKSSILPLLKMAGS